MKLYNKMVSCSKSSSGDLDASTQKFSSQEIIRKKQNL